MGGAGEQDEEGMSSHFPSALSGLLTPEGYAHAADDIVLVETPISWVLLAGQFAYKIKRPVQLPFIDMHSLERRRFLCQEELRLNRRFAPELYLQVCCVVMVNGAARMGGGGVAVEYAVRMQRFDRQQELDRLLESGRIEASELAEFGRRLAAIHERAPIVESGQPWGEAAAVRALVLENWQQALSAADAPSGRPDVEALHAPLIAKLDATAAWFSRRRDAGRVRECHGDLHTRNIARIHGELVAFDCVEFEPSFRWIDVADECALLLMDMEARDRGALAHAFWDGYLEYSGDYQAHQVLDLYKAHRALVRAKVSALSWSGSQASAERQSLRLEHSRLIECAAHALSRRTVRLVLMCGLSGSGKTWLARRLAPRLNMIHVRSDVERKRLAGLPATARSGSRPEQGLYAQSFDRAVYERLESCAESVLTGGYDALVDATFARRIDRGRFAALAARLQVTLTVIHCRADLSLMRARIVQRERLAADASEADERVLELQLQRWEPLGAEERFEIIEADTAREDLIDVVLRELSAGASGKR